MSDRRRRALRERLDALETARDDAHSIVFVSRDDDGEWVCRTGGEQINPEVARERGRLFVSLGPTVEHRIDPETLEVASAHPLDPATGDAVDAVELDPETLEGVRNNQEARDGPINAGE